MRKFTFRLQKVLDHALHVERGRQKDLGEARRSLAEADRALMRVMRERDDVLRRSRQPGGPVNLAQLRASWAYARRLGQDLEAMKRVVEALAAEAREKQASLLQASKDRALLDRLREQKLAEHEAQAAREEQATQDETARSRHLRAV